MTRILTRLSASAVGLLAFLVFIPLVLQASSAVPSLISYQGSILDSSGNPVGQSSSVNRTATFRIWNHATNSLESNLVYSEQQEITISNGQFSCLIGSGSATAGNLFGYSESSKGPGSVNFGTTSIFDGAVRFLGVTIDDGSSAVDNEITPRQQIVTTAFAFRSKVAESVDSAAISLSMMALNSVGTNQIVSSSVTGSKIANSTITGADIAQDTITAGDIASGGVGSSEIINDSITASDIANNAVTSAEILNSTITSNDIKDSTITGADIAANTITAGDIATNAVNYDEIAADAVRASEIQANAVLSAEIKDGEVKEADLNSAVMLKLLPTGSVMMWAGSSAPSGWFLCDGSLKNKTTYSTLYGVVGNAFGTSGGSFRVPDLRGRFVRGVSGSATRDPDRGSRTAMNSGGNTGNNVGSVQGDALKSHSHQYDSRKQRDTALSGGSNNSRGWDKNDSYETKNTATTGGSETRPTNAYLHFIIKY